MKQLHNRTVFEPVKLAELTDQERRRTMKSLIFLVENRDKTVKARTCANGSTQREYIDREDAASPTAITDSILITSVIDTKQGRDVMTVDVPNAFVQTEIDQSGEKILMKIRGVLVDILVGMEPEDYKDFVVVHGKHKVLYVWMLKALYGMLVASLLYYKRFLDDITKIGFERNQYDPCVANRMINNKQHTITWHVDDIKSNHVEPEVNDKFLLWLNKTYGEDGIGNVKAMRGKRHDYLAMILDFSSAGVFKLNMIDYIKGIIKDFTGKLEGKVKFPWTAKLFTVDKNAKALSDKERTNFHTFVMKCMFLCKRARQDIQPGISFLSTRTIKPNEGDWRKLIRLLFFLKATQNDVAELEADDSQTIQWHVDALFAVHNDFKSHTEITTTLGKGTITSVSTKQKANARSLIESELIDIDDGVVKILWTKLFIQCQGFFVKLNLVHRDNTLKLEENEKSSSGKCTRHFNITYFYVTDLVKRKEITLRYCPTKKEVLADYMTKPLVGAKFKLFRNKILNLRSS